MTGTSIRTPTTVAIAAPEMLTLKVGARIMMVKNDKDNKGGGWRETRELFKLLNQELREQKEVLGEIGRGFQTKES